MSIRFKKVVKVLVSIMVFALVISAVYPLVVILNIRIKTEAEKKLLFEKTDHEALLQACRKLMVEKRQGKWQKDCYDLKTPGYEELPRVILELNPMDVCISENVVTVSMYIRQGICVYGDDYKPLNPQAPLGKKELIPGLWYYEAD